jgi:hypothetical protein
MDEVVEGPTEGKIKGFVNGVKDEEIEGHTVGILDGKCVLNFDGKV